MKELFEVITTILCINSVTPVLMYYIYDDNPTVGFVDVDNTVGEYVATYNSPRKQFTESYGSRFHKYTNEHVVDSHFKVMKSPSRYVMPTLMDKNNVQRINEYRMTAAPNAWRQNNAQGRTTMNIQQQQLPKEQVPKSNMLPKPVNVNAPKNNYSPDVKTTDNQLQKEGNAKAVTNIQPIRPKAANAEYTSPIKQRPRALADDVFEPKSNFVQMNVRKSQIMQDPQKLVRINNNVQAKTATVLGAQKQPASVRQRISTSVMVDKTLQKANGLNEHGMQAMTRVLDDLAQQVPDRRQNKGEYRKRDTTKTLDLYDKANRSSVSDNIKKYIGKDRTGLKERIERMGKGIMEMARIGSHEDSLEINGKPYALFYRMNPESLDQQEAFVLMKTMEANGNTNSNTKEKRTDDMITIAGVKTNNAMRLLKKMKLLNNFEMQK